MEIVISQNETLVVIQFSNLQNAAFNEVVFNQGLFMGLISK